MGASVDLVDNDIGSIEEIAGHYVIKFKKLTTKEGKELECVHSGNVNDILLPAQLPGYTILRREIAEALDKKGLTEASTPMKLEPEVK